MARSHKTKVTPMVVFANGNFHCRLKPLIYKFAWVKKKQQLLAGHGV